MLIFNSLLGFIDITTKGMNKWLNVHNCCESGGDDDDDNDFQLQFCDNLPIKRASSNSGKVRENGKIRHVFRPRLNVQET